MNVSSGLMFVESNDSARAELINDASVALQASLRSGTASRTFLVVAAGNDAFIGQPTGYSNSGKFDLVRAALFSVKAIPEFSDRIVVVAGTSSNRSLWSKSNYVIGLTDIAAPAEDIPILGAGSSFPVRITRESGTSYAAPMVAATLAAMAAAAPDLSPAELKDVLIAGTNVPDTRPDGTFGRMPDISSGNAAVSGLRELDVYGALVALRRRVPTAPLCGDRLSVRQGPGSWHIEMAADSGAPRTLELPPFFFPQEVTTGGWGSVAQGGRLMSVNAIDPFGDAWLLSYRLQAGGWTLASSTPTDERRVYLERDTAYWAPRDDGRTFTGRIRRRDGTQATLDGGPAAAAMSALSRLQLRDLAISPDGKDVIALYRFGNADLCSPSSPVGVAAVSWRVGAATAIPFDFAQQFEFCFDNGYALASHVAWHPSSRSAVLGTQFFGIASGARTTLQRYTRSDAGVLQVAGGATPLSGQFFTVNSVRGDAATVLGASLDFQSLETRCEVRAYPRLDVRLGTIGNCGDTDIAPLLRLSPTLRRRGIAIRRGD